MSFAVLQLRPEDETADGEFAAILRHGGLEPEEVIRHRCEFDGVPDLDLDALDGIIVGGSPYDVSAPQAEKSAAQLKVEASFRRLFDDVVADDLPFLGACSGNGLLGSYLGAPVTRRFGESVMAINVTLTSDAMSDPLLHGFPNQFRVLVGHKEACDVTPPGAVLLARGEACPVQMFRVGQNVYATQFHPEGDGEGFAQRIRAYRHHGYFDPGEADQLIARLSAERTPWSHEILRRFTGRYRGRRDA